MAFRNFNGMLAELNTLEFESDEINNFLGDLTEQTFPLTEEQLARLVALYNIHCIPKKFNKNSN